MISLTMFKSIYDNKTHRRIDFESFEKFEKLLYNLSKMELPDKKSGSLFSPATYIQNTTRANRNVIEWSGWSAIDVDDIILNGNSVIDILNDKFGDYYYVCYSTASSSLESPKFRLVFPLTHSVDSSKIKHFWFSLNKELNFIGDSQTKDLSRMYYIPAKYKSSNNNFIFTNKGKYIDPNYLMEKYRYSVSANSLLDKLPEDLKKEYINYRKNKLNNTSIIWSSYRDCPFVSKKILVEYNSITNTGWYHKMYQMMVSIASSAFKSKYPITAREIATLCREIDNDTGKWYSNRPLEKEANRAIQFVFQNI